MDKKNKSQKNEARDESKTPIGKRHDDNKPNADKKKHDAFNKRNMSVIEDEQPNDPDKKRIEIDDNPGETERKIPRMKE